MYLFLAIVWLTLGVLVQVFWTSLQTSMRFPLDRTLMGVIFFVFVTYNLIRWRLSRAPVVKAMEPRFPPRVVETEYDPNLDFTRLEEPKNDPPK